MLSNPRTLNWNLHFNTRPDYGSNQGLPRLAKESIKNSCLFTDKGQGWENKDLLTFPCWSSSKKNKQTTQRVCSVCGFFPHDLRGVVLTGMELTEQRRWAEEQPSHANRSIPFCLSRENILAGLVEKLWKEGRDISENFPLITHIQFKEILLNYAPQISYMSNLERKLESLPCSRHFQLLSRSNFPLL